MARSDEQTNLRFPKELKDWLRQQAVDNKRSLNSEVIVLLQQLQRKSKAREDARAK